MARRLTQPPMTRGALPKVPAPPFDSPTDVGASVALYGTEIQEDLGHFVTDAYRGMVTLTAQGRLERLYAARPRALARLLCFMIDRLGTGTPISLHLHELPGALELSISLPTSTLPSPDLQYTLLAMAAEADVALRAERIADATIYHLRMREDYKLPTLRAAGGESLYACLMAAFQQLMSDK